MTARAYEEHAEAFLGARDRSTIGAEVVSHWARSLGCGKRVLELGCGGGLPVTRALVDAGLQVWAVDSSPTLLATFRARFPDIPVDCANALESRFFERPFDAVIAIGLVFLLNEDEQAVLIQRCAEVVVPGGKFLFTAPLQAGTWKDAITGQKCLSLGIKRYESLLADSRLRVLATYQDEGQNNHYEAERV